jgi:hypothetical protein
MQHCVLPVQLYRRAGRPLWPSWTANANCHSGPSCCWPSVTRRPPERMIRPLLAAPGPSLQRCIKFATTTIGTAIANTRRIRTAHSIGFWGRLAFFRSNILSNVFFLKQNKRVHLQNVRLMTSYKTSSYQRSRLEVTHYPTSLLKNRIKEYTYKTSRY